MKINAEMIRQFGSKLVKNEKSKATVEKYIRDVTAFFVYLDGREADGQTLAEYKKKLVSVYAPKSVNSIISGDLTVVNSKITEKPHEGLFFLSNFFNLWVVCVVFL